MPSEMRHILFRPAEVLEAVREYHRRLGRPLPPGQLLSCGPETEGAGSRVRFRVSFETEDILVDSPILAAALILYCHDRRIPLPAQADKSLLRFGEQICLLATINPRQDDMPAKLRAAG